MQITSTNGQQWILDWKTAQIYPKGGKYGTERHRMRFRNSGQFTRERQHLGQKQAFLLLWNKAGQARQLEIIPRSLKNLKRNQKQLEHGFGFHGIHVQDTDTQGWHLDLRKGTLTGPVRETPLRFTNGSCLSGDGTLQLQDGRRIPLLETSRELVKELMPILCRSTKPGRSPRNP